MDKEFSDALNHAVKVWSTIVENSFVEESPECKRILDYGDYITIEQINSLSELDPSGVSTVLALYAMQQARNESIGFTLHEILKGNYKDDRDYKLSTEMAEALNAESLAHAMKTHSEEVVDALMHYKVKESSWELASDLAELARIRECALRSFSEMEVL